MGGVQFFTQFTSLSICTAVACCPALCVAQPDYGLDFVTVGAPGNRPTNASEVPNQPGLQAGAVDHAFRITRTEVLVQDWLPFVRAYQPYWTGSPIDSRFTSSYINPGPGGVYEPIPGSELWPVGVSWHMAARYVNWLANGRGSDQAAFENGVYDTSTFTMNPDFSWNDQATHTAGAPVWIPSYDELFKSFYYDPNRYGPGQDGYWVYPNSSNVAPVSGVPGVGTTNAGLGLFSEFGSAGLYPGTVTPWGLLDASGGEQEYVEGVTPRFRRRWDMGTSLGTSAEFIQFVDRADWPLREGAPDGGLGGFRVAAVVPSPNIGCVVFICLMYKSKRRAR